MPNIVTSTPRSPGWCSCPYPHFTDEEINLERRSRSLESGKTEIHTQICKSKVNAPNFYGFPGCLQRDWLFCATNTWIGLISLGLGWVLSAKELMVEYPADSSHLACGLEPVMVMVPRSTGHVCPGIRSVVWEQ